MPLLVDEAHSRELIALVRDDPQLIVWWGAHTECASAVHRLRREGVFGTPAAAALLERLGSVIAAADVVQPGEELAATALRLLAVHPLRAADALQLAAALVWARGRGTGRALVCIDERLTEAALLEGFTVLPADG